MIEYIIPLLVAWVPLFNAYLVYYFAAVIVAWVPMFILALIRR